MKGGRLATKYVTTQAVYNALSKRVAEARLGRLLSPYDMRRTFIVMCPNCGRGNVVYRQEVEPRFGR